MRIRDILSKKKFIDFLESRPKSWKAVRCDGGKCPIAEYMHHIKTDNRVSVGREEIAIFNDESIGYDSFQTPKWAKSFIIAVDSCYGNVTKKTCIDIMRTL